MADIANWLAGLGLEKYVNVFTEAEIDRQALPHLTEDDLKELGLPLGPRRKVLGAIAELGSNSGIPAPAPAALPTPSSDAERRHLTVMFVDLVGSTEMATKLDAEDMRGVITDYQNTVAGVVTRFDGFTAKFMGDGVLCYFGWPRANEDDAERAVRAGLEIISGVQRTSGPDGTALASRVGIATGVVIVGDLIGAGATQEAAVVGETPNLAARLQGLARPNQLVLPQETRALLGAVFELEPLGAHALKGIGQPVEAFAVIGESDKASRFESRQLGALTPIVGRERETELMLERWATARSGSGQMIVVSGEAGIGKSRITRAVIDAIARDDHARITFQCSPYHSDSALHPIIQQMTRAACFEIADDGAARLDKLEKLPGVELESAALLAALLGLDGARRYGVLDLSPAQQRARTLRALVQLLVRQAVAQPLLVVFEDLHWVDPTSLELLDLALDAIADSRVLILGTARPTFEHGFGGHPIVTRFALNRLGREQIAAIVLKLTGGRPLPEAVMAIIASRTDGVPLFVEELTRTVLDTGVLRELDGELVLAGPLNTLAIPTTLHDSLMARLDRLQPIKEVAQMAACIGREFDYQLLAGISPLSDSELGAALDGLIKAELVYRRGLPPEATYLFKHALVRDAAYGSLLKERRRAIHGRILLALEGAADTAPEVLAHHAEAAGLTDHAIDLWEAASKAAIARPAYDESISHLERAIALIAPRIEAAERTALERALGLQVQLGVACMARKGWGAQETKTAFERALVLADLVGETPLRFSILYGLMTGRYLRAEHAEAVRHGEAFVQLAENAPEAAPAVVANRAFGITLFLVGRFSEAQRYFDRAFALYDPAKHKGMEKQYGQDLGVGSNCFIALNVALLGETQRAKQHVRVAERYAMDSGHAGSICYMHMALIFNALLMCDETEMERHTNALALMATEHNLVWYHHLVSVAQGLIAAGKRDLAGIKKYLKADAIIVATKSTMIVPWFRIEAGRRALVLGLREEAHNLCAVAQEMMDESGEFLALSDLHRLKGALALDAGDEQGAETHLQKAIEVARDQGSKLWELRAAIDLARLWTSTGRAEAARDLLRPVRDSIADGDCIPERAIAREMLTALAG